MNTNIHMVETDNKTIEDPIKIEIWDDYNFDREPDKIIELEDNDSHILSSDPHHFGKYGFRISSETRPAELNIFTNDSVREPHMNHPTSEWNGPIERGLVYKDENEHKPFGVEIWGRVLLHVEKL